MADEPQVRVSIGTKAAKAESRRWYRAIAILGVVMLLMEYGWSFYADGPMNKLRTFVASVIAFVGFYGMDPPTLQGAGTLVYTWTSGILTIIRRGKRTTDTPETQVVTKVDLDQNPPVVETHAERLPDTTKVPHTKDEDLSHD